MLYAVDHKNYPQRQSLSEDLWIDHDIAVKCLKNLKLLFQQPSPVTHAVREGNYIKTVTGGLQHRYQGMMLIGDTGSGKTEILRRFKKMVDAIAGKVVRRQNVRENISLHPIVYVETPAMSTKHLFKAILDQLNYPYNTSRSAEDLFERAVHGLQSAQVQMLMLDEFQNVLLESGSNHERLMNKLRYLSNHIGLSLVLAGTPEVDTAVASYPALMNRLFPFDIPKWENGEDFQKLIRTMSEKRNIFCDPPLHDDIVCDKIYTLTEGRIGEMANLLFRVVSTYGSVLTPEYFDNVDWVPPKERRSRFR